MRRKRPASGLPRPVVQGVKTLTDRCLDDLRLLDQARVTIQALVLGISGFADLDDRSPILYSPFSSWAWYLWERATILP